MIRFYGVLPRFESIWKLLVLIASCRLMNAKVYFVLKSSRYAFIAFCVALSHQAAKLIVTFSFLLSRGRKRPDHIGNHFRRGRAQASKHKFLEG